MEKTGNKMILLSLFVAIFDIFHNKNTKKLYTTYLYSFFYSKTLHCFDDYYKLELSSSLFVGGSSTGFSETFTTPSP